MQSRDQLTGGDAQKWRVTLFGTLAAERDGQRITRFQTQKTALLFAFLALNPGKELLREVLCETCWPYSDPEAGRASLNQAIASIRKTFGVHNLLLTDRRFVALNYDLVEVDVDQFHTLTQPEDDKDVSIRQSKLEAAVALYSDKLLTGIGESWVRIERLMLSEKYLRALNELGAIEEEKENFDRAIHWQQEIVRADPKEEAHHIRLLRLYGLAGNVAAARRHYEELVSLLQEDGRSPSGETRAVVEQIVSRATTAQPHENPADRPNRIPLPLTQFHGREDLIALVTSLWDRGVRLITFVGLPGIGKTRLAVEIAHREAVRFDDIVFVPLADITSCEEIASKIGAQIGWETSPRDAALPSLIPRLAYGGKRLLVLDNFDHLLDCGVDVVRTILDGVPNVHLLITSQVSLGLNGEQKIPVEPLPVPKEGMTAHQLALNPSYTMLLDRIRAVVPTFSPAEEEEALMADLCRQLEGFPLALELAATLAETTSVAGVLSAISQGYEALSGHAQDVPTRHQSLESSFQHCFSLLPANLRRMLGQLAVFEGGWTWEAVDCVLGDGTSKAMAKGLLSRALIAPRPKQRNSPETRFEMLGLLRHFSLGQIEPCERAQIRASHADYYAQIARESKVASLGAAHAQWVVRLREESGNLAAAFASFEAADQIPRCLSMAIDLGWFWIAHGNPEETSARLARYIDLRPYGTDDVLLANAYQLLGHLEFQKPDHDRAQSAFNWSLGLSRVTRNRAGIAQSLNGLGALAIRQNEHSLARRLLEESIEMSDEGAAAIETANNHLYLAFVLTELGEYEDAKRQFDRYLSIESHRGNVIGIAKAYSNLSHWARFQKRYELATHYAQESLRIYEGFDQKSGVARATLHLAQILVRQSDIEEAAPLLDRAMTLFDDLSDPLGLQSCICERVRIQAIAGNYPRAASLMAIEKELAERVGALRSPADESDYSAVCAEIRSHVSSDTIETARLQAVTKTIHEIAVWARSV